MKTVKLLSLVFVALFISTAIWAPIAAAKDLPPNDDKIRAESKGAEVRMFFRGSVVTPTRPTGNSSAELKTCQGKAYGARMFGVPVATWKATVNGDVTATGQAAVTLWARSQAGAKNAGFRVNLMRSGGNTQSLFTNRQTLSAQPVKFTATGTYNQQFNTGDTFDVQLIWLSDPKYGIGPAGSGEFLYGNAEFDSNIKIAFQEHPISIINISAPVVSSMQTTIKADFHDILGADPSTMVYNIAISGATTANSVNIGEPAPSGGTGNSSSVSWVWKSGSKGDNARSGSYQVTVGVSYDGNSTASNTSMLDINFPTGKTTGGGNSLFNLKGGNFPYMLTVVIILVVVIVVIVAVVVMRNKKGKKKKQKYDEDEEEEEEEEEDEEDEDEEDDEEEEDEEDED